MICCIIDVTNKNLQTHKHTNTSTFLKEQQINHILSDNEIEIRGDT